MLHRIARALALAVPAACALLLLGTPAGAQSDVLLRLRSGSPLGDRFRVDSAGGLVAMGTLGIGIIPATGCGYRMMWHPYKGAFRAGTTDDGGACTYWDDANVGFYSWAGGNLTRATAFTSFAFGDQAEATGVGSAAFGSNVSVTGTVGFGGGANHNCSGFGCTTFGFNNTATGQGSVAIGYRVTADSDYGVALGHRASTNGRSGAFVWADASTTDSLETFANNSFRIRASGGVVLYTNSTTTTGVYLSAGGSAWNVLSDRHRKEELRAVDGEEILARVRTVPVSTWRYLSEEDGTIRHIGPMAQDWQAAFGFSSDSTSINSADFDGVNLAAVQALERRTAGQAERIGALEAENAALRARLDAVERARASDAARLERLEALVRERASWP